MLVYCAPDGVHSATMNADWLCPMRPRAVVVSVRQDLVAAYPFGAGAGDCKALVAGRFKPRPIILAFPAWVGLLPRSGKPEIGGVPRMIGGRMRQQNGSC